MRISNRSFGARRPHMQEEQNKLLELESKKTSQTQEVSIHLNPVNQANPHMFGRVNGQKSMPKATYIIGLPLKKFFICQAASKRTKYPNRVLRAPKP